MTAFKEEAEEVFAGKEPVDGDLLIVIGVDEGVKSGIEVPLDVLLCLSFPFDFPSASS